MTKVKKMVYAAVFLALTLLLPFVTGQIPQIGSALSPMHIPVLICGFVCGWPYGLMVGAVAPLLRMLLFQMPPPMVALAMTFELAAYGLCAGLLYQILPKKPWGIMVSLAASMVLGRLVWGVAMFCISMATGAAFTLELFLAGAFLNAIPGIVLHLALVPMVVLGVQRAGYLPVSTKT